MLEKLKKDGVTGYVRWMADRPDEYEATLKPCLAEYEKELNKEMEAIEKEKEKKLKKSQSKENVNAKSNDEAGTRKLRRMK